MANKIHRTFGNKDIKVKKGQNMTLQGKQVCEFPKFLWNGSS